MTAVLSPMQGLTLDGGIMPPSPISQGGNSRHGRSKHGGSVVKGGKARGRGYSVVEDRETIITKALTWVLKRTVTADEEHDEDDDKLTADAEGWVDCEEILEHPNISTLQITLPELHSVTTTSKPKFAMKPTAPTTAAVPTAESDPASYTFRLLKPNVSARPDSPTSSKGGEFTAISASTSDLPDLIVYETSYPNYPLILASGGLKRAGGQAHLSFASISVAEDGTEIRAASDADVYIYIDIRSVLQDTSSKITWSRNEAGVIVTKGDESGTIPKKFWKRVVARRADIGVLYEDGTVKKEIPVGLRGKGVKGKNVRKGKGNSIKELKGRSEEDSASD